MMRTIPFIQVGVGNRGAYVLQETMSLYPHQFTPVAFVDIVPEFLSAATQRPGLASIPTYATLGEALAAQPQAEAVFIVTPARFHTAMVAEAVRAGKHVWVEKPLTYSYEEAAGLAALAREQGRAVVIGNQYQYHPLERQLQALVQSERYGKAFHVSYLHHRYRPEMRAFTGEHPALWEQGVHSLNSILAILGNPDLRTVYALGLRPAHSQYNSDTITNVLTEFADGAQAHLLVTFDSQRSDWSIRVECEQAAFLLQADGWERSVIDVLAGEKVIERIGPAVSDDPLARDPHGAFYTAITTGQSTPTSIETNLKTIQWIDAAVRSLHSGGVIHC